VTFNNNVGSTKSYDYVREHVEATATFDFVPVMREIKTDYEEGTVESLQLHDGSFIRLHKLAEDWNPLNRLSAMNVVQNARANDEILTGLLYLEPGSKELHEILETSDKPLNALTKDELCPGSKALEEINAGFR
jgi:2-oxoglutarate ferredoxin oxidoreductase subunit beta